MDELLDTLGEKAMQYDDEEDEPVEDDDQADDVPPNPDEAPEDAPPPPPPADTPPPAPADAPPAALIGGLPTREPPSVCPPSCIRQGGWVRRRPIGLSPTEPLRRLSGGGLSNPSASRRTKPALNAFAITFSDRFPAAETY